MAVSTLQEIVQYEQFDNLEFIASQIVAGFITGLHRSPYHGFSVEFAEHRVYNNGESTKHIDWKLFARTEKLFVKQYEEETNLRSYIVLDTSSSMLFPYRSDKASKLQFSVYCAAALIYMLRKQRDASGLCLFSDQIENLTDTKLSVTHSQMMYALLQNLITEGAVPLNKPTSTAEVLHQLANSIHKRSLVILFTDMFSNGNIDEIFAALQHIRYNKHEVIIFNVKDKQMEEQFEFSNRPHIFVDMESGREIKFSPNEIRETYKKKMAELYKELELRSRQYKIDFVEADINEDFREVLLPYLIKRSQLF
ncbi:DUF58 domain-containing protein [Porphyromonadaceae bacterium OttesenSCG-928-L07]|nr:DUF58 domain-containing protein [Porphyromonadaceae bacterium OttesenSCG-928-L07]MDL2252311.1 DUF58 domain-containing protein [Odoribacter sp. OttesenSCG-928-J03]MDL2330571.1 DUF58 domain-containing protein [Odoribacter sp. OttesenSCG-928-A06]